MARGRPRRDLTGKTFGHLTVLEGAGTSRQWGHNHYHWRCSCSCGTIKIVRGGNLSSGHTKSCGCKAYVGIAHYNETRESLLGRRFGRLLIVEHLGYIIDSEGKRRNTWVCLCDCGNTVKRNSSVLTRQSRSASLRSCGCARGETVRQKTADRDGLPLNVSRFITKLMERKAGQGNRKATYQRSYYRADLVRIWKRQNGRCALTGIVLTTGEKSLRKASMDRIDSSICYTPDNIWFVCLAINFMKNAFDVADCQKFIEELRACSPRLQAAEVKRRIERIRQKSSVNHECHSS